MKKKTVALSSLVFACIFIVVRLVLTRSYYHWNGQYLVGTIEKTDQGDWGFESNNPDLTFTVINLPGEIRQEKLIVSCKISVSDVIGTGKWDVYTDGTSCRITD